MINSVLIIKLSAIGDVIMPLPAVETLRRQNPTDPFHFSFYNQVFLINLVTSAAICNFNNLLFYMYRVIWVFPFVSNFYLINKEKRSYAARN